MQTEETINIGERAFFKEEERCSKHFENKPRTVLTNKNRLRFNIGHISLDVRTATLHQLQHMENLGIASETNIDHASYALKRSRSVYIA